MLIRRTLLLAGLLCVAAGAGAAQAPWPSKPIRIVVPYGPARRPTCWCGCSATSWARRWASR